MSQSYGNKYEMVSEVMAAAHFVSKLMRTRGFLSEEQLQCFTYDLQQTLSEYYKHHWFPDRPQKGSGYRCIRINHKMDPIISKAASRTGLSSQLLFGLLPKELTLWVDPYEVSYRIGEDGSICVLYDAGVPVANYGPSNGNTFYNSALICKNRSLVYRANPPKHYLMTVSS